MRAQEMSPPTPFGHNFSSDSRNKFHCFVRDVQEFKICFNYKLWTMCVRILIILQEKVISLLMTWNRPSLSIRNIRQRLESIQVQVVDIFVIFSSWSSNANCLWCLSLSDKSSPLSNISVSSIASSWLKSKNPHWRNGNIFNWEACQNMRLSSYVSES